MSRVNVDGQIFRAVILFNKVQEELIRSLIQTLPIRPGVKFCIENVIKHTKIVFSGGGRLGKFYYMRGKE